MKTNRPFHSTRTHWATALLVAAAAVALTVNNHAAKPGGGGGTTTSPACVEFDPEGSLQSDTGSPYCDDHTKNVSVTFSPDGHLSLDSNTRGAGRSVFVDFGAPISVVDGANNVWTFQTTAELDAAGIEHDLTLSVGAWQADFNMLTLQPGDFRADINLMFNLFLHFPGQKMAVLVVVKLAPQPLSNERQCEISDAVKVTCTGVDAAGKANAWRVETQDPDNEACVSQKAFGHDLGDLGDLTIGIRNFSFGFIVTR